MMIDRYWILVHDGRCKRVLLQHSQDAWGLPHFDLDEPHVWQDVSHVNRWVLQRWRLNVTTLRCLHVARVARCHRVDKVYVLETHDPTWVPPTDMRWFSIGNLDDVVWPSPNQKAWVEEWLASDPAAPWYRPGWWREAQFWFQQQLVQSGNRPVPPVEQLRSWGRAQLLHAGRVYMKAVPPMFAHELRITKELADYYPGHFPQVLALDRERNWFLMADVGDRSLAQVRQFASWEQTVQALARIQVELAKHGDWLLGLGCPERRLDSMAAQIDPLLADTEAMQIGCPAGLTEHEGASLRALAPQLKRWCRQLADYAVPYSLEHGDFWSCQVLLYRNKPVFIDWSDSSLAHPFFSLVTLLQDIENELPAVLNARERLRDAYLAQWASYQSHPKLVEAYEIARPLAMLHLALIYYRTILPGLSASWEMENMLPWFLKKLVEFA